MPRSKGRVAFIDSGVGGLPYLALARACVPDATLHYIADDAGFPYGTKSPEQLVDLLHDRVRRLRARLLPDVLVIACNTASQTALQPLRVAHPDLPIIGTVPAIKPAAASTKSGRIAVMATERTIVDPYLDDLIARYAPEVEVLKVPAQPLVTFVERHYLESSEAERRAAVYPFVKPLVAAGVDRIILACTHFLHVESDIAACASDLGGKDVEIVESLQGVANRLVEILAGTAQACIDSEEMPPLQGKEGKRGVFLLTGEEPFDPAYASWAKRFALSGPEGL